MGVGAGLVLKETPCSWAILEAQNRIGGRIDSVILDGVRVDIGGYEISIPGNTPPRSKPFIEAVQRKNLKLDQRIKQSEVIFVDGDGQHFTHKDHEVVDGCFEELLELIKGKVLEGKVESYYQSGKELIDKLMDEGSGRLTAQQRKLFCLELQIMEEEEAASIYTMSNLVGHAEIMDEKVIDKYPLPEHGYHHLLQTFAEDLP